VRSAVASVVPEAFGWLLERVPVGGLVADLGCGPGRDVALLREYGRRAVGVDLSSGMLALAATRAPGVLALGDLRALPLRDGCCDGIWSSYALLHLDDAGLAQALREAHRVLRPGGTASLVLAAGAGGCAPVPYAPEHARVFFARDVDVVTRLCGQAGLEVLVADVVPEAWRSPVRVLAARPSRAAAGESSFA
jgi:SAM-dependent methyltransferase